MIRLVTSWATKEKYVDRFIADLEKLSGDSKRKRVKKSSKGKGVKGRSKSRSRSRSKNRIR